MEWHSRAGVAGEPRRQQDQRQTAAPRVIAVTSGRRGVGKSCLVVNLGLALTRMGKKVLILDADLHLPAIACLLGMTPPHTIAEVLAGTRSLAEVMVPGPGGLTVVPGASQGGKFNQLSQAHKLCLLEELDALAGEFDFLLVDAGAGLSSNVVYFNVGAQERIVVADQDLASVTEAYTLIKVLATRYAEKRFKLLFNRISRPQEARRAFDQLTKVADRFLRGSVSLEYLGWVPEDDAMAEAVKGRKVLLEMDPLASASVAVANLADILAYQEPEAALDGNIKFFWQNLHHRAADAFSQGVSHASQLR